MDLEWTRLDQIKWNIHNMLKQRLNACNDWGFNAETLCRSHFTDQKCIKKSLMNLDLNDGIFTHKKTHNIHNINALMKLMRKRENCFFMCYSLQHYALIHILSLVQVSPCPPLCRQPKCKKPIDQSLKLNVSLNVVAIAKIVLLSNMR